MELEVGGRRYPVTAGAVVIGADPGCEVVLDRVRPRHAVVRRLGERMATIQGLEPRAEVTVNGVTVGVEPTPLLDGDVVGVGPHVLTVRNPNHPAGGPTVPPPGARERLHDTLFGMPRRPSPAEAPPPGGASPPPIPSRPAGDPAPRSRAWIVVAAVLSLALLLFLLLR